MFLIFRRVHPFVNQMDVLLRGVLTHRPTPADSRRQTAGLAAGYRRRRWRAPGPGRGPELAVLSHGAATLAGDRRHLLGSI